MPKCNQVRIEAQMVLKINRKKVSAHDAGINVDGDLLTFGVLVDPQFLDLSEFGWKITVSQFGEFIGNALANIDWREFIEVTE